MDLSNLSNYGKKSTKKTFSWNIAYSNFETIKTAFNKIDIADHDELRNKLRTKNHLNDKFIGIMPVKKTKQIVEATKNLITCFVDLQNIDELKKICLPKTIDDLKKFIVLDSEQKEKVK